MKSLHSRILVFVLGVFIGILGVAGILLLRGDVESSSEDTNLQVSSDQEASLHTQVSNDFRTAKANQSDPVPLYIKDLVFPLDTFHRKAQILFWVEALTEAQVISWLEQSTEMSWDTKAVNRIDLQTVLLQRFAAENPHDALEFVLDRDIEEYGWMYKVVVEVWAQSDLSGLITHAKKLNSQVTRFVLYLIMDVREDLPFEDVREIATELVNDDYWIAGYFRILTNRQIDRPREVWYELTELVSDTHDRLKIADTLSHVAAAWFEDEGERAFDDIVKSIHHDSDRPKLIGRVLSGIASVAPEELFDYLIRNFSESASDIISSSNLGREWARKDRRGLWAKLETNPYSIEEFLMEDAIEQWVEDQPLQVLELLGQIPPRFRDSASRQAIEILAQQSPKHAASLVMRVIDDDLRAHLSVVLIRQWVKEDVAAATDWVLNKNIDESIRNSLIDILIPPLVESDPQTAFELARQRTPTKDWHLRPEVDVVMKAAAIDIDIALSLLPQLNDIGGHNDVDYVVAHVRVGTLLIEQGETEQAFSLVNQFDGDDQITYYAVLAQTIWMSDRNGIIRLFEHIPDSKKSATALLILRYGHDILYSDDEIAQLTEYMNAQDTETWEQHTQEQN